MTGPKSFDDRVTVYLAIESAQIAGAELTSRLGMPPDREWAKGDLRGKTGKRWECHGWVVETTVRSDDHGARPASELIPIALDRFECRLSSLAREAAVLGDSAKKYAVLVVLAEEIPGIEINPSLLRLLSDAGASFQITVNVPALVPITRPTRG